jgi:hypothetical protein
VVELNGDGAEGVVALGDLHVSGDLSVAASDKGNEYDKYSYGSLHGG